MTNDACDTNTASSGAATPVDDAQDPQREALVVEHMTLVSHIVRETMTRVPAHVSRALANTLGRAPENHEVAASLGLSVAEVESNDGDVARANVLSLQGSEVSFEDMLVSTSPAPSELVEHREKLEYLVDAIAELPERLRIVVQEYFLAERPMAEIAETLGVTESRVSQIRAEALVLLRDALNSALDPSLVPPHARPDGCASAPSRTARVFSSSGPRRGRCASRGPWTGRPTHHPGRDSS